MALECGVRLGSYEVLSTLGAGGMGEVYRARDARLSREVAIKVLPDRLANDTDALARFDREAKAVAALSHPNILAIHDVGCHEGTSFAVMELLQGESLRDQLRRAAIPWRGAVRIAIGVADGLAAAHLRGIIHRDLKPDNIFLTTDGVVKILDFGLARMERPVAPFDQSSSTATLETKPGTFLGTVHYMSPEQIRGQPADARSDIFSLGCVLFEMVTRHRPFSRETAADAMAAILNEESPTLAESGVRVPAELQRAVAHCLEKEPGHRFQSARDLAFALGGIGQNVEEAARNRAAEKTPDRAPGKAREKPDAVASLAVLPFADMSPQRDQEYFCEGLAEELINALSKIHGLHVASRTSAFAFKGKNQDIREMGSQLNVGTVLEGSVRKAGEKLRINAQLVNVVDGYHLWSESFDRQLEDVFAVQDEIAQSISRALRLVLGEREKRAISKARTTNVQAYDYYLRGRQNFHQFRRKGFEQARKLFVRAYQLDPGYASAYAGVADCCSILYMYFDATDAFLSEADQASRKALELDPDLAEAHVARGLAVALNKRFAEARQEFETAIRQNPDLFEAYYFYARACFAQGKLKQSAELFERACRVRPEDFYAPSLLATVYDGLGRKTESDDANRRALVAAEKHLEVFPDDARALYYGGFSLVALGERERGVEWTERALAAEPEEPFVLYNVACTYALLGETERALHCLDEAITFGWGQREWLENDSDLDSLRRHPRFQSVLDRLKNR